MAIVYASTYVGAEETLHISADKASLALALAFGSSAITIPLRFRGVDRRFARFLRPRKLDAETGLVVGFNPESMVHMVALIYCIYLLSGTILTCVVAGGLSGLASDFGNITPGQLWLQLGVWLLFAAVGVGLGARRSLASTLRRLGLRAPTVSELVTAGIVAIGLYCAAFILSVAWQKLAPKDVYQQQNVVNEEINNSINTLTLAFLLAFTAELGEAVAFRGALQPVFGLWPTSILFAAIHVQYALAPASALIFIVAIRLGWLRRKYNTTTSIVGHFLYDYGPVALVLLSQIAPAMLRSIR